MKLRAILFIGILLAGATVASAQIANVFVFYSLPDPPLTMEGTLDGTGTPLTSDARLDVFLDDGDGDITNDIQPTVGTGPQEWSQVSVPLATELLGPGYHASFVPFAEVYGDTLPTTAIYFVVYCPNGLPVYYSERFYISDGPNDLVISCSASGDFGDPCWRVHPEADMTNFCVEPCVAPDTVWFHYSSNYIWDEQLKCVELCVPEQDSILALFGPFPEYCMQHNPYGHIPISILPGCDYGTDGCTVECEEGDAFTYFNTEVVGWTQIDGEWYASNVIIPEASGCVCVAIEGFLGRGVAADCWLPVELMSFEAAATAEGIEISFRTASETDNARFEILRSRGEGGAFELLASLQADNFASGSEYRYLDRDVVPGQEYRYTLVDISVSGERTEHPEMIASAVASEPVVITEYKLSAYPNPFNPTTTISFNLPDEGLTRLAVHDIQGREVAVLVDESLPHGRHELDFDGAGLTSGVYFVSLKSGTQTLTHKLVLLK